MGLTNLWSLMRYPSPSVDEMDLISRAIAFARTGIPFGPLDGSFPDLFPKPWLSAPLFFTWFQSLALRFFATPNLEAARLLSLVCGGVLLLANFWIARRLGGRSLGLVSTLFLSLSVGFFYAAHWARYDSLPPALGYLAVAIVLYRRPSPFWSGLIAGLVVSLAVETHFNSLVFGPAILALIWLEDGHAVFRRTQFWGFALGAVIGAAAYLAIHVLPSPQSFMGGNLAYYGPTRQPPIMTGQLAFVLKGFADVGGLALAAASTLIPLAILQAYQFLRRPTGNSAKILVFTGILLLSVAMVWPGKMGYYALYVALPIMWLASQFPA